MARNVFKNLQKMSLEIEPQALVVQVAGQNDESSEKRGPRVRRAFSMVSL